MSRAAKISFLSAALLAMAVFVTSFMTQGWLNLFTVGLYLSGALVFAAIAFDYKLYYEFFTMRTTKHGMNMGAAILVALVCAVCVNYLGNLHNISWDVTTEKLNSLSDESRSVLKNLKDEIEVKVFTRDSASPEQKQTLKQTLSLFSDYSGKIKVRYVNPYIDNALAMEYLNPLQDRDAQTIFVFVEHGGKKLRADAPFDEAAITSAIIKSTRGGDSKIYFVKGHGEKDIDMDGEQGIKDFAHSLGDSSFKVESLNLVDQKKVPDDATAIAIIGPKGPFLEAELKWLHEYAAKGGKFFIALDPGQRSNLAALLKSMGVEFANNYVFTLSPLTGGGPALIAARGFDPASEITRNFAASGNLAMFYIASEVKAASDKPAGVQVQEIVRSDKDSFTLTDISQKLTRKPDTKPVAVATESKGKIDAQAAKDFSAVVFGDSDFIANQTLMIGVNRDLGMNAMAMLTDQKDLLSIRPKMPKGTMMILTGIDRIFVVMLGIALPLFLLITAGVVWFRRRGA